MSELAEVLTSLSRGEVVAIPTDTVYGLACIPRQARGIRRIFELKGRPDAKPLPVLGDGVGALETVATFDERAYDLARRFWPGPLTLVLPRASSFAHDLGGDDMVTVAVRVPQHPVSLELLSSTGPLAVTSANRSGEPPAISPEQVRSIFKDAVMCIEGGVCDGTPSTVLSLVGPPKVIRDGALTAAELMA